MYGIDNGTREYTLGRIKREKEFLESNYFEIGSNRIRMSELVKNAYHNANRYIAEVNHRVNSLFHHATNKGLKNIFGTITLPSEYHRLVKNKYHNPKYCNKHLTADIDRLYCPYRKREQLEYDKYSPKAGTRELSRMFKQMIDLRAFRNIDKEDRCYFRVYEPHKDGTPHLHFSMFVPEDEVENVAARFREHYNKKYPGLEVKFETDIKNPVAYLMKYILKTFDDLRDSDSKVTDLSLWYKANRVTRFYTSKTLISLEVYRKLGGRYNLLELTHMYKNRELSVLLDIDTNKIVSIYDSMGNIYNKKETKLKEVTPQTKLTYKKKKTQEPPIIIDGITYINHNGQLKEFEPIIPVKYRDTETIVNNISELIQDKNYDTNAYGLLNNELLYREFKYFDIETREIKCDEIIPLSEYGV